MKKIIFDELEKFETSRNTLFENLRQFFDNTDKKLILNATNCHLRPTEKVKHKCELCETDLVFHQYAKYLFAHSEEIFKFTEDETRDSDDEDLNTNENQLAITQDNIIENLNRGKKATNEMNFLRSAGDVEKLFKLLCTIYRNDEKNHEHVKTGKDVLELYASYKEEFKSCRQFWLSATYQINAYDELEMAKIRIRLKEPKEVNKGKENYIIDPSNLQALKLKTEYDKKSAALELRRKLGQFLYLSNLSKVNFLFTCK